MLRVLIADGQSQENLLTSFGSDSLSQEDTVPLRGSYTVPRQPTPSVALFKPCIRGNSSASSASNLVKFVGVIFRVSVFKLSE